MTYTMTRCTCLEVGADFDCSVHGPCQGCYEVTGLMMTHDGTCDGLTEQNAEQMRTDWHPRPEQEQPA